MAGGHKVYAGIRDTGGRNQGRVRELQEHARSRGEWGRAVELDILDDTSCQRAAAQIFAETGSIDVVVHNAAHLYVGVSEAFSPEQLLASFDTNAVGSMRVNRAVLPFMREAGSGYLIWVGSGVSRIIPPFLAPYAAAKAAQNALAEGLSSEISAYGIDTTIVMPGPFMKGTEHFANAEIPADEEAAKANARLADAIAANGAATAGLFAPGEDPDPITVAHEITRLVALPPADRPYRTSVDFSDYGDQPISAVSDAQRVRLFRRMGFGHLLDVQR
jgi:NAD(P)-dependent dehydrogenase (short-subunit alcohol dehydrogenase family)